MTAAACARPPPGPALRLAVATAPEALDPRFTTSALGVRLSQLVAPPLCVPGDDGRARLLLARSITQLDDLTVEARLGTEANVSDGLRFPDGDAVTAEDVAFSFASIQDPATASPHRARLADLEHVEVTAPDTVRFHLKRPSAPFVVDVVCAVGVLQQKTCRDLAACRNDPQGAGAWRLVKGGEGDDGDHLRFAARSAKADLDVRVVRDGTARLLGVIAGDLDVTAGDIAPWDASALPASLQVLSVPGLGFSYLGINARRFDDDVRGAIAAAVDVDAILAARLRGRGARASGLLPPTHWAKDPSLQPQRRDLERARSLLQGRRVRLSLLVTPDRLRRSVAVALRDQLSEAGIDVDIVVRDWSVVYDDLKAGRFDLVIAKWTPVAEPDLLTTVFHSKSIPSATQPGGNRGGFVDHDIDAWLDAARVVVGDAGEAERRRLYGLVERRVQARAPLVPLWFDDEIVVAAPRVIGLSPSSTGSLLPLAAASSVDAPLTTAAAP